MRGPNVFCEDAGLGIKQNQKKLASVALLSTSVGSVKHWWPGSTAVATASNCISPIKANIEPANYI